MDMKEKLVDLLCDVMEDGCIGHCNYPPCYQVETAANHLIANGIGFVTDNNVGSKWIPVTERLPEECPHPYDDMTKAVLIYTPVDGYTHIGWYAGKDYRGRDVWKTLSAMRSWQTCTKKVTHWQYLPQPPKGE